MTTPVPDSSNQAPADRTKAGNAATGGPGISPEVIESVEQLAGTWKSFLLDRGAGDISDVPGMLIRWADSKFAFWNCLAITDQGCGRRQLEERCAWAVAYMRRKSRPGLVWVFEDLLAPDARAGLAEAADRAGLQFVFSGFSMAGDILPIPKPHHPHLEFERVTTERQLLDYADLNSLAYGMPLEAGRDGLGGSALWKSAMQTWLGLENGVPVSAAATIDTGNCLYLALVATRPDAQRKGYGEATVRKALYEGARVTGLSRATLHATEAGAPVYERIGYHKVTPIRAYGLKG